MEAPIHVKIEGKVIFGYFLAAMHQQHIEKEIKEVPKEVFNFCLQAEIRKEIIRLTEKDLFFTGINQGEMGIVVLLIEVFKVRSKIWWL